MGFFVMGAQDKLGHKGIYFVSPKKFQIKVYRENPKQEIDLQKELRKDPFFYKEVLVGKANNKMRLAILPLPPNLIAERKRKALRDRDKRLNHSKEYYYLLGYSILLTNIPQKLCSAEEISRLYGLRWQIEIIFRSWKSGFHLEKLTPSKCINPDRIYCMIYLWLIFMLLFHTLWVNKKWAYMESGANLSILKLAMFFFDHFPLIISGKDESRLRELMYLKCKYDRRNDRMNIKQKYEKISA